jgi:hypothetical protein
MFKNKINNNNNQSKVLSVSSKIKILHNNNKIAHKILLEIFYLPIAKDPIILSLNQLPPNKSPNLDF